MNAPKLKPDAPIEVTYTITIEEETDVTPDDRFATDEPEKDAELCRDIRRRLDRGDTWAWCMVTVHAAVTIEGETFQGRASLGACSYDDEKDFRQPGGYFDDLCQEAWHDLIDGAVHAMNRGDVVHAYRGVLEASAPVRREPTAIEVSYLTTDEGERKLMTPRCGAICTVTVPDEPHAGGARIGAVCVLAAGEHAGGWHLDANGHRFAE